MNKERREQEHPAELESQFVLKLPEEPAKQLRELLRTGDSLKNRLTIQIENDMRHGEVKFDNWVMHAKIVDLPTIIESLKTIDNKSFYKAADICQMMICKEEPDQPSTEEENPAKTKKKDPYKVDKKFLWPHGITPPTKNVRKRRFRKTLKKKYVEAPEIEKEVKRLLRADNEAESISWEVIKEDEDQPPKSEPSTSKQAMTKPEKKSKTEKANKREFTSKSKKPEPTNVVDIFGGAVSDSDLEEDNTEHTELHERRISSFDKQMSDANLSHDLGEMKRNILPIEFESQMFESQDSMQIYGNPNSSDAIGMSNINIGEIPLEEGSYQSGDMSKDNLTVRLEQLKAELIELKQRRQRTQHEISGMENLALRQRFQDNLHSLNQDIMYKEMEYQGILTLQNSEDI